MNTCRKVDFNEVENARGQMENLEISQKRIAFSRRLHLSLSSLSLTLFIF